MNNKTLAILLLVILAILLLILILSCEISKSKRKRKSSSCASCKKKKDDDKSPSCKSCESSVVSLNSFTADNVYVAKGDENKNMNITFADKTNSYNTLEGNNKFTYNPSTNTLNVGFINAVLNGSLNVKDGIVYQNDSKLDSVPYKDKNGMILTVENGKLKWKNPNDIFSGGGGPVENLSNKTPNGILYQDGPNETKTLSYGSYGDILYINQEGKLQWINPESMESLRGPPGADGIYGLKYKWDAYSDIPDIGEITLEPTNTNLNIFNLYVSINDFNRINTEILFSDLKQGDKITVQLLTNDNYSPSQTFEVNSTPIKRGNYFEINVKTTVTILTNINHNKFVYVIISNRGPPGPPGADGISGLLNLENAQKDWVLAYDPDSETKLKWKPDATGGSGGGSVSNLSKTPNGILYQTGPYETSVLAYENNQGILINDNGRPRWVNPSNMESLKGRDGINGTNGRDGINGTNGRDGINGTNGRDGVDGINGRDGVDGRDAGFTYMWNPIGGAPSYGRITLNNNTFTTDNSFNIFINDVNGINTEILFSGLDKGDKITLNWRTTSSNIYSYRTFTLTSKSIKINNYFQMGVDKITNGFSDLPSGEQLVYVSVSSRPPEGKISNELIALGGLEGVTDDFILAYKKDGNKLIWRKDREGGGTTGLYVTNYP